MIARCRNGALLLTEDVLHLDIVGFCCSFKTHCGSLITFSGGSYMTDVPHVVLIWLFSHHHHSHDGKDRTFL